uniref:Putative ribonuclease H-like domain-containing protein n=1 Tax=Tanacetum cinerariifolium TaxID=118510 RepID=A0A699I2K6_TANCI|nr:putative ribonuclease H-like domain-containing protein [Tanacetum cinerariifolium]
MTEIVTAAATQAVAASTPIPAAKPKILNIAVAPAVLIRRRKGVVIRDPEEKLPSNTPAETPRVKDKGKGILIEAPKPIKKKDQIEMDAEYARKLQEEIHKEHEETYKNIDWNGALDHVKSKEPQYIKRYHGMKKKPQTESEARKNMIFYLKNTEGYKMDFFKGMKYDEILPIFQAKFDANIRFLFKSREEMEAEDQEIIKSINETPAQKVAKRRKLSGEVQEAKYLRKRLEIVEDEDDDVFVKATPLAQKVPVVDYHIAVIDNKPRKDLETLWRIVRDRFSTSKPTNFSDEYLLLTLKTMFEEQDGQDAIWRNQKSVHGLALVKRWKMLTSCGVHVITLSTVQLFLLVERRYPLSRFTLEQLVNVARLQVEEESKMYLELLRSKKNTKCINAANEELTAAKHKLMLLVQRATSDAGSLGLRFANDAEELQKSVSAKTVPPGSIPVPTGSIPVSSGDDVPVYTSSPTDSFFDDEPTTRFPSLLDFGNHDPLPGIFSSSSYDDELGAALNNVASTVVVSPVATKRINIIYPQSVIVRDPTLAVQKRSKNVWVLVELPKGKYAIGTKWILKNKRDARGIVVRNKARHVAQGHQQEEGIDYDEVFAPVARIEAIRLFLAFASYMRFMVYQMDVKSAFLYKRIDEEVYVTQPKSFADPQHPKKVYKVVKAIYGLHQAPRAWYATLSTFLLTHGYRRGIINKTLFLKKTKRDIILVQAYVDDIIFRSTKKAWCDEFEALMKGEFQMSALGEHTFFLGLQVQQRPDGMFISQDKYVQEILNKFDLGSVKTTTTPYEAPKPKSKNESDSPVNVHLYRSMIGSLMHLKASRLDIMFAVSACSRNQVSPTTSNLEAGKKIFKYLKGQDKLCLWYPRESPFVLEAYSDSDYAGANKDRKSTTSGSSTLNCDQHPAQTLNPSSTSSMATLRYRDKHNNVGYLLQPTGSDDYHQIIDFLRASHIQSSSYQSYHDKTPYTINEDLVRSQLQLADDGGIDDLPIAKIYSGMDNLCTKSGSWDQFGSPLAVALVCLFDGRQFNWLNFEGHPMPLLAAMLSQDQEGEGTGVAAQAVTVDSNISPGGAFDNPAASTSVPADVPTGVAPPGCTRLHDEEQAQADRQRAELQRRRQQEVLASAMYYTEADWINIMAQVEANASLSKTLLGDDVSKDNFPARMAALIKRKKQVLVEKLAQEKKDRPMTQGQQRTYIRQFVKNQSCVVYSTRWSMARVKSFTDDQLKEEFEKIQKAISNIQIQAFSRTLKRTGPVIEEPYSKRQKSTEDPIPFVPEAPPSPVISSPKSSGTRRKSFGRNRLTKPKSKLRELDLDADAQKFIKVITTPLRDINALYRIDWSIAYFTTLRDILHMMDRQDLVKLYGLVVKYYETHPVAGAGLILWGNLQVLFDSYEGETISGEVVFMFADVSYPLSVKLMARMLTHKLEIDKAVVGNDMTIVEQLIRFIKYQLAAAQVSSA